MNITESVPPETITVTLTEVSINAFGTVNSCQVNSCLVRRYM